MNLQQRLPKAGLTKLGDNDAEHFTEQTAYIKRETINRNCC